MIEAAERLGYRPNPVARSLRTRRSHTIGVLIPDLTNPLFPPMIRGLEDRLAEYGYVALIGNTDADDRRERMIFDQMRARHVDGFLMATATLHSQVLEEATEADLPVVLMNRTAQGYPFPSVSVDNEQGIRAAVTHLKSLGHTRIGHIAGPQDISTGVSRYRGFLDGIRSHGLPADESQVVYATAYSIEEGQRCARELLARDDGLTAIVAANDMLAVGCYGTFDELGIDCPGDVSLTGFNDMPFMDRLRPPLSTVRFPHYQLGAEAAKLLVERIDVGDGPVKILYLAPELIARGSTCPPESAKSADAGVAEAGAGEGPVPLRRAR